MRSHQRQNSASWLDAALAVWPWTQASTGLSERGSQFISQQSASDAHAPSMPGLGSALGRPSDVLAWDRRGTASHGLLCPGSGVFSRSALLPPRCVRCTFLVPVVVGARVGPGEPGGAPDGPAPSCAQSAASASSWDLHLRPRRTVLLYQVPEPCQSCFLVAGQRVTASCSGHTRRGCCRGWWRLLPGGPLFMLGSTGPVQHSCLREEMELPGPGPARNQHAAAPEQSWRACSQRQRRAVSGRPGRPGRRRDSAVQKRPRTVEGAAAAACQ